MPQNVGDVVIFGKLDHWAQYHFKYLTRFVPTTEHHLDNSEEIPSDLTSYRVENVSHLYVNVKVTA